MCCVFVRACRCAYMQACMHVRACTRALHVLLQYNPVFPLSLQDRLQTLSLAVTELTIFYAILLSTSEDSNITNAKTESEKEAEVAHAYPM